MAQVKRRSAPSKSARAKPVADSFQNLQARLGVGANNLASGAQYALNPITRNRVSLDYMYRGSWIVGAAIDAPADDMTREGIDFTAGVEPEAAEELYAGFDDLAIWEGLADAIRWGGLYGGAIALMQIDGQNVSEPLRVETIGKGQFKGLMVFDRWQLQPSVSDIITEPGPWYGYPRTYEVVTNGTTGGALNSPLYGQRIHYSRCFRFEGLPLPFYQRQAEFGWGMSKIERLYDRLVAFDSATQGAAQLIFKAHLRTLSVEGLTQILGAGGPAFEALVKRIDGIRRFQSTEGMSVIDAKDKLETSQYAFSGLGEMMLQFAQQISGALQIPLVRLLGQSPAGLNSSGDSDLRTYYDGVKRDQKKTLRYPITTLMHVMHRSVLGVDVDRSFAFAFNPLWQLTDEQKATIAESTTRTVTGALAESVVDRATALKELRKSSRITGVWSNITDEDVTAAENDPPPPSELTPEQLAAEAKVETAGAAEEKAEGETEAEAA